MFNRYILFPHCLQVAMHRSIHPAVVNRRGCVRPTLFQALWVISRCLSPIQVQLASLSSPKT
jgi:hypothetical protein